MNKEINFTLHLYTDIIFGKDTEKEAGRMVRKHGGSRVMLVYGGGSVKKSGLLGRVVGALKEEGLYFIEFGGVQPNPRRSLIEKGIKAAQDDKIDFLLALGGGSVIDSCKAIALALANGGEYWKFYNKAPVEKMAPIGAITTISATGSETSRSTVVLDDIETGFKRSVNNDCCRPRFAIMNPELCYSVSSYQTGAGAVDIAAHALGRYFLRDYAFSRLGDEFAEGLLRTVVKYASTAISNPCDYTARAELMMAAAFSHNDLVCLGCKGLGAGEHALERQFSGYYDVAHGAGLAVVMPAWLQYIVDNGTPGHHARI
ncbi:MAG: iron-containing alcohol dehydrogenase, partial [Treponema sp.]|nr:iron-containing alcohol dehydrogenase [Treponema sp.]